MDSRKEYDTRKEELIRYCKKKKVSLIIGESEQTKKQWKECVKGLESAPERGAAKMITGDAQSMANELVDLLINEAKVL